MIHLDVHVTGQNCWPDLVDKEGQPTFIVGRWTGIARLPGGTARGRKERNRVIWANISGWRVISCLKGVGSRAVIAILLWLFSVK